MKRDESVQPSASLKDQGGPSNMTGSKEPEDALEGLPILTSSLPSGATLMTSRESLVFLLDSSRRAAGRKGAVSARS